MKRMYWAVPIVLALCGAVFLLGCGGPIAYVSTPEPIDELYDYTILEVSAPSFDLPESESFDESSPSEDAAIYVQEGLVMELQDSGAMPVVTPQAETSTSVLILRSTVVSHDKGNRAARYLIGMGAGAAKMIMRIELIDKQTGKKIAETDIRNEMKGGLFGGSADARKMGRDMGKGVSKFLKKRGKGGKKPGTVF